MLFETLSKNLTELRKKAGLSQEELAEKISVSRQAVSKWERGEAYPDIENLVALSRLFGVSLDYLVDGEAVKKETTEQDEASKPVKITIGNALKIEVDRNKENINIFSNDDDEDDEDDENDEDDEEIHIEIGKHFRVWYDLPYPILITIAYLLWGFFGNGWAIGWTLYVTIPVYYSVIDCIRHRKLARFCYPVFVTFAYLLMGMAWGLWHPWWILFVTIPVFYAIAAAIDKRK